jgi:hypothetical protein
MIGVIELSMSANEQFFSEDERSHCGRRTVPPPGDAFGYIRKTGRHLRKRPNSGFPVFE